MKFFDEHKSILENLYLLSGPIIALFGFFIFRQISLAKEQIIIAKGQLEEAQKQLKISSKRDSIKLAAEQIYFLLNDIVKHSNDFYLKRTAANIDLIEIPTKVFEFDDIKKVIKDKNPKEYIDKLLTTGTDFLLILNLLETFATYFIQEVADENVAFEAVGATYCSIVEQHSYILSAVRKGKKDKPRTNFSNLIKLYNIWSDRLESIDMTMEKEIFENEYKAKMAKMNNELSKKEKKPIKPLGTE